MSMPKVITISGEPGSGTTTIGQLLSKELNIKMVYIGEIFRELAGVYNMTLSEFGEYAEDNPDIDHELDTRQVEIAKQGDIILEGRLSGWMMKKNKIEAFKILLTADLDTRVQRIMGREGKDYEQVKAEILKREACEQERYTDFYDADYHDQSYYDLIIDTSELTPDEIVEKIKDAINNYKN